MAIDWSVIANFGGLLAAVATLYFTQRNRDIDLKTSLTAQIAGLRTDISTQGVRIVQLDDAVKDLKREDHELATRVSQIGQRVAVLDDRFAAE